METPEEYYAANRSTIEGYLQASIDELMHARPEDPLAFLSKHLAERAAKAAKAEEAAAVRVQVSKLLDEAKVRGIELRAAAGGTDSSCQTAIVLTGGPGVGKTTLIEHLSKRMGCAIVREAALQAIDVLNKTLGKEGQKQWRTAHRTAFGDMVGRLAMAQEADAAQKRGGAGSSSSLSSSSRMPTATLFDRTVLDNLGYSMQRGYPLPGYVTTEVVAAAVSRIDHVLVLDQVASIEDIERRNAESGRMTDPAESVRMSDALEQIYLRLGCRVSRIRKGTVEQRGDVALAACGLLDSVRAAEGRVVVEWR